MSDSNKHYGYQPLREVTSGAAPVLFKPGALLASPVAAYTANERAAVRPAPCADCIGACKMAGSETYLCARQAWPEDFK